MPVTLPTAILGSAAIGAGGSIASGILGSNAAKSAAQTQAQAYQQSFGAAQSELQPFVNNGTAAGNTLASFYGLGGAGGSSNAGQLPQGFINSPAYQFPYQQGLRGVNFGLGASGLEQSGSQAKATQSFGQGLASQYLMSNYINPLFNMYGTGAQSAQSLAGFGSQAAIGAGTASAAGTVGSANAITGAIGGATGAVGSGVGNLALYSLLAKSPGFGGAQQSNSSYQPISGGTPGAYGAVPYPQAPFSGLGNYGPQ